MSDPNSSLYADEPEQEQEQAPPPAAPVTDQEGYSFLARKRKSRKSTKEELGREALEVEIEAGKSIIRTQALQQENLQLDNEYKRLKIQQLQQENLQLDNEYKRLKIQKLRKELN